MGFAWEILGSKDSTSPFHTVTQQQDHNTLLFFETVETLPDKPLFNPIAIQVEPTDRCNLQCGYCSHRIKGNHAGTLSLDKFKYMLSQLPYVKRIHLQGLGEPFICKDLFDMIQYAKEKGCYVSVTTNGTICTPKILTQLSSSGLDSLSISIDTLDPAVAAKQRAGSKVEQIWQNVRQFATLDPGPEVGLFCVITQDSLNTLSSLIMAAAKLNLSHIFMQEVQPHIAPESYTDLPPSSLDKQKTIQKYRHLALLGKNLGIPVSIAIHSSKNKRESCLWPWTSVYIKANGDVTPCCIDLDYVCGNLFEQSWSDIWHDRRLVNFRQTLRQGPLHKTCAQCSYL